MLKADIGRITRSHDKTVPGEIIRAGRDFGPDVLSAPNWRRTGFCFQIIFCLGFLIFFIVLMTGFAYYLDRCFKEFTHRRYSIVISHGCYQSLNLEVPSMTEKRLSKLNVFENLKNGED